MKDPVLNLPGPPEKSKKPDEQNPFALIDTNRARRDTEAYSPSKLQPPIPSPNPSINHYSSPPGFHSPSTPYNTPPPIRGQSPGLRSSYPGDTPPDAHPGTPYNSANRPPPGPQDPTFSNDPNLVSLKALTVLNLNMELSQFKSKYQHPFLVQESLHRSTEQPGYFTVSGTSSRQMGTADLINRSVYFLRKKANEIFSNMVTVGRTNNNDVVISSPRVSKFHAYFSEFNGHWQLTDSHSTNGTYVNDQRIGDRPQIVKSNSEVAFGSGLVFRFLDPMGMYHYLHFVKLQLSARGEI